MKALTDQIVAKMKAETPAYQVPKNLATASGQSIGWGINNKDGKPKFTADDFFVTKAPAQPGETTPQYRLFVRHTSKAGKITVWEFHKTEADINDLQGPALDCLLPNRQFDNAGVAIPWAFFKTLEADDTRLWTINQSLLPSESQLKQTGLPAAIVNQQISAGIAKVRQYCDSQALFYLDSGAECTLPSVPSAFPQPAAQPAASKEVA